ncbi:mandelate racemase/muconate lactonizing enzyme family protein [Sphingopyxis kveilinensis]|uniref:mandelate racemase/muconate lactonizing enzyme family protein n=1 Tax=Sphingopyxis kveilinensis TaxID=3114367 RepID=UPI0030D2BB36
MTSISTVAKIRHIAVVPLHGESPKNGWASEIKPTDSIHALISVHTDIGVIGLGSVFTDGRLVQAAVDVLKPLWEGENAMEPERVSEKLHQNSFWTGRGGTLTHAISGIDIAMWDILGKVTGQPVGRLLGGYYRTKVQPYCSLLIESPEQIAERIREFRGKGFRAFKIGWGPIGRANDPGLDEAIVGAAREAAGPESRLLVDAGASDAFWPHGLKWALRTAEMLAGHDVEWLEEPLPPDALEDFIVLRRQSPVPIAGGEVLTRRQSFLPWIERGALDVVQPDVTKVGGISEQRRIAWAAWDRGIKYVGHGWNTALGLAADMQLAAANPSTDLVEFIGGSAYIDGILAEPFILDADGLLTIPQTPGLSVTLDPDKLRRLSTDPGALFGMPAATGDS